MTVGVEAVADWAVGPVAEPLEADAPDVLDALPADPLDGVWVLEAGVPVPEAPEVPLAFAEPLPDVAVDEVEPPDDVAGLDSAVGSAVVAVSSSSSGA